jgi:hypothetical protein
MSVRLLETVRPSIKVLRQMTNISQRVQIYRPSAEEAWCWERKGPGAEREAIVIAQTYPADTASMDRANVGFATEGARTAHASDAEIPGTVAVQDLRTR